MRRFQCLLLTTVALTAFASITHAADVLVKAPPTPPVAASSWTGWYIGGNAGWVGTESNITNTGTDTDSGGLGTALHGGNIPTSVSVTNNGFIGGGQIGYNWQTRNLVYGFEADFDGASAENSAAVPSPANINHPSTATFNRELDWLATVRGRVGITATPSFLLFATGGIAIGQTKIGNSVLCPTCIPPLPEPSSINQNTNTSAGWTAGAGAEWMFAPRWSLKAEYLYVDLGSHSSTITYTYAGPNTSTLTSTVRDSENIVRGGINYHF